MKTYTVMMPRELTAENGAKELLSGEFYSEIVVDCPDCGISEFDDSEDMECDYCHGAGTVTQRVPVSWTTIKAIYAKAVEHLGV